MFDETEFGQALAVAICRSCGVRQQCLDDCLAVERPNQRYGVRGGLTPAERQAWQSSPAAGSTATP